VAPQRLHKINVESGIGFIFGVRRPAGHIAWRKMPKLVKRLVGNSFEARAILATTG
jgi:hypothetical protein